MRGRSRHRRPQRSLLAGRRRLSDADRRSAVYGQQYAGGDGEARDRDAAAASRPARRRRRGSRDDRHATSRKGSHRSVPGWRRAGRGARRRAAGAAPPRAADPLDRRGRRRRDVVERILAHTKNARELRDERRRAKRGDTLSAIDRVKKTRARMASYLGTSLFLFGINYVTGDSFWWCLFPIFGIGLGVARDIGRLWADGVPLRALVSSKALRDLSALPAVGAARAPALGTPPSAALPPGVSDDTLNGPFGAVLRQGIADHKTITDLESRLSEAERKLL